MSFGHGSFGERPFGGTGATVAGAPVEYISIDTKAFVQTGLPINVIDYGPQNTGWLSPGSSRVADAYAQWDNPSNAYSDNGVYATKTLATGNFVSNNFHNFNAAIPAGATIIGVEARGKLKQSATDTAILAYGLLTLADTSGDDRAQSEWMVQNGLATSDTVYSGGASTGWASTFWGGFTTDGGATHTYTPTLADINSSDFGVIVMAANAGVDTRTVSLDYVQIKVHYTPLAPVFIGTKAFTQTGLALKVSEAIPIGTKAFTQTALPITVQTPGVSDWFYPTNGWDSGWGTTTWANPGNVVSSNDTYATTTIAGASANASMAGNYIPFDLPAANNIKGVQLRIEGKVTTGSKEVTLELMDKDWDTVFAANAALTTTESEVIVGSPTNLIGAGWLTDDLVNNNYSAIWVYAGGTSWFGPTGGDDTYSIDALSVRVFYGLGETISVDTKAFVQTGLPINVTERLAVGTKSFTQTKYDINVNATEKVAVGLKSFTQTKYDINVNVADTVAVGTKAFTQTKYDINVNARDVVAVGTRAYTQSPQAINVNAVEVIPVGLKSFTQTKYDINVNVVSLVTVDTKAFVQTGLAINVNARDVVAVGLKSYTQSKFDINVNAVEKVAVDTKTFVQTGLAINVNAVEKVAVGTKAFVQAGLAINVSETVAITTKAYTQSGLPINVNARDVVAVGTRAFAQTGQAVVVNATERIAVGVKSFVQTGLPPKVSEAIAVGVRAFSQIGQAINVNAREAVAIGVKAFAQIGQDINVNIRETIALGVKAFSQTWLGLKVSEAISVGTKTFVQTGLAISAYIDFIPVYKVTMSWKEWVARPAGGVRQVVKTSTFSVPLSARTSGRLNPIPSVTASLRPVPEVVGALTKAEVVGKLPPNSPAA